MHRRKASATLRKIRRDESSPTLGGHHSFTASPTEASERSLLMSNHSEDINEQRPSTPGEGRTHTLASDLEGVKDLVFGSPINLLLVFVPLSFVAVYGGWSQPWIFALNFMALMPLAKLLGDATETLALHTGQSIGGLINATFGNAVEVVIAIFALRDNQIRVVQASMIGSILSNLLLVLGCCFLAGGIYFKECDFNAVGASANSSLLMLSALGILIPTPFAFYGPENGENNEEVILLVSRLAAGFLLFMYVQLLLFQLKTHFYLFDEDDDEEEPEISALGSATLLLASTLMVSIHSEYLVGAIDGATEAWGIGKTFVGVILLPIVGNAVEHVTAVSVAMKGKMELSMGVAVGSATQVSMFVVPVIVLCGWAMDKKMTLSFPVLEVSVYLLSIIIVYGIIADGKSNWLEGTSLLTAYCLIAVAMWFEKSE